MKKFKLISFIAVLTVLVFFVSFLYLMPKTQAQGTSVSGYATITNMGYKIYFSSTESGVLGGTTGGITYSVQYDPTSGFSGYGWSPEYGWVNFTGWTATVPSFVGVNDTESFAWANGLIKLSGTDGGSTGNIVYKVVFDPAGIADTTNHWAWGGNVLGWIDFSGVSVILTNDLCPNIDGIQTIVPVGMIIDSFGNCINPSDVCPNISGIQTVVPTGMIISGGNCVWPAVDVCPNIDGIQNIPPSGMIIDSFGNCVDSNVPIPTGCTLAQTNDIANLQCYCPAHPTSVAPDCVHWCLINGCKKIPHYIEN